MGSGEDNTPGKPPTTTASTQQETPSTPSYDWSQMQAFYGPPGTPPPFFTSNVASPTPHPYMWPGQHLIPSPYGTPIPYPAIYPHGGMYPHPSMPMAQDAAQVTRETEGKVPDGKERVSTKKSKGNSGVSVGKSGENAKVTSGSGNDGASQSGESGSEDASESSDENTNRHEASATKKKSFNQMLADGANAQNNDTAEYSGAAVANLPNSVPGKPAGTMPGTNLNIGMDLWNTSAVGTVPLRARPNASGVSSAIVPAKMVGREGVPAEHLWVQDERELKRQKRKQSNRESARRSRLRKQAECEELQGKVETLSNENHSLHKELQRLSEECEKLATENKSLMEELGQLYGPDSISVLDANMSIQPINSEGTGQDDSRGNNSVSGQTNGVLFNSNNNLEPGSK